MVTSVLHASGFLSYIGHPKSVKVRQNQNSLSQTFLGGRKLHFQIVFGFQFKVIVCPIKKQRFYSTLIEFSVQN